MWRNQTSIGKKLQFFFVVVLKQYRRNLLMYVNTNEHAISWTVHQSPVPKSIHRWSNIIIRTNESDIKPTKPTTVPITATALICHNRCMQFERILRCQWIIKSIFIENFPLTLLSFWRWGFNVLVSRSLNHFSKLSKNKLNVWGAVL